VVFLSGSESLKVFFHIVLSMRPNYQEGVEISSTGLTPLRLGTCFKLGSGLPTSNVIAFSTFNDLMSDVFVRIVDIGEIIDHHCFIFLAIRISV
jgi:hypothetical protein